jgi:hypothetical protein
MEEKPKYKKPRCPHDKIKAICKLCGGGSICPHQTRKADCKICGGSSICVEHNKKKSSCKECKGTSICEHNRRRSVCVQCGGKSICEHSRIKSTCKECKGTGICEHNKLRSDCKACKGSSICIHEKNKRLCKSCGGSRLCKTEHCETKASKKYNGYCLPCCIQVCPEIEAVRNYKTKESTVVDIIKEKFPNLTWIADKKIKDGCSNKRPDLLVDMGTHIIILEIDENKHSTYDCSCENKRLMLLSQDVGHRPIVFIRFNPDGYIDNEGITVKSCWKLNQLGVMKIIKTKEKEWEERMNNLIQQIQYWIINPTEKTVEIVELYY